MPCRLQYASKLPGCFNAPAIQFFFLGIGARACVCVLYFSLDKYGVIHWRTVQMIK